MTKERGGAAGALLIIMPPKRSTDTKSSSTARTQNVSLSLSLQPLVVGWGLRACVVPLSLFSLAPSKCDRSLSQMRSRTRCLVVLGGENRLCVLVCAHTSTTRKFRSAARGVVCAAMRAHDLVSPLSPKTASLRARPSKSPRAREPKNRARWPLVAREPPLLPPTTTTTGKKRLRGLKISVKEAKKKTKGAFSCCCCCC